RGALRSSGRTAVTTPPTSRVASPLRGALRSSKTVGVARLRDESRQPPSGGSSFKQGHAGHCARAGEGGRQAPFGGLFVQASTTRTRRPAFVQARCIAARDSLRCVASPPSGGSSFKLRASRPAMVRASQAPFG